MSKTTFIAKAQAIHGEQFDYTKVNYLTCHDIVTIHCSEHGYFEATPRQHLKLKYGGCSECFSLGMSSNKTRSKKEFVQQARKKHGDTYDYRKVIYTGCFDKVEIVCSIHGTFYMTPSHHASGGTCPECRDEDKQEAKIKSFVQRAKAVHGNKYDYSKSHVQSDKSRVVIICSKHGEFTQQASVHLGGSGCSKCSTQRLSLQKKQKAKTTFSDKANKVHGNKYDYSKTNYVDCTTEVKIICSEHGVFYRTPSHHLSGHGCPKCIVPWRLSNTKDFVKKANKVHGNKYDYSKVSYVNSQTKVEIVCPDHGSFHQAPYSHLNGRQCPACVGGIQLSQSQFIEKAIKVHAGKYTYEKVKYKNSKRKVIITCPKHGDFKQVPNNHLNGSNCPCCATNSYSQLSIEWLKLEAKSRKINIQHAENGGEYVIPGTRFRVDGYHARTKTIFEFYGDCFHGNPKLYKRNDTPHPFSDKTALQLYTATMRREKKLKKLGYRIISIWESDFL